MSKTDLPVDPETLHAMAEDLRVLVGKLRRRMREEAHIGDFTPSQVQVLGLLEREGPATVTALARAQGMRPQSMGETLSVLKAAGLVSGAPDPNDGRQTVLSLTPAFRKKVKASRAAREDWLFRTIQTRFSPAEQQQLAIGVDLLKRLIVS
ncbi:MarR family transcriptional regulator [Paraburkholderia ginsengiterrae]|uniref:MarR family transcriptional regulator n=1 Tax=Paraburkholderia ginsengiterrae TaxID=1462993 RepID=A0A1A9NA16_9BURK|nr:MarR family transcriptional regulator [Paraburkholderia ginsengiterrae]OAJ62510.1 MarR family transcriptional regulator [Paraburkholderia ginsengiterrae]OAJ62636.1 MarR family transcriptional regulator [Paraburkholderia ginsengiterrae]